MSRRAVVLTVLALVGVALGSDCVTECTTCGTAATVFHELPRLDAELHTASANIASYDVFSCSAADGTCSLTSIDTSALLPRGRTDHPHAVETYLQTIGMYVVVAMTVVVAAVVATVVCFCSRCPYCICSKTGCCGGRKSARRAGDADGCCARFCGCGLGMVANESGRLHYPHCGRWSARICAVLFIAAVGLCVLFGELYGIKKFPSALKQVSIFPCAFRCRGGWSVSRSVAECRNLQVSSRIRIFPYPGTDCPGVPPPGPRPQTRSTTATPSLLHLCIVLTRVACACQGSSLRSFTTALVVCVAAVSCAVLVLHPRVSPAIAITDAARDSDRVLAAPRR